MDKIKDDFLIDEKKDKKRIKKWFIFVLLIVFIVGIGYMPLYIYKVSNNAWVEYDEILVITLNGTIKEKIVVGHRDYYNDNNGDYIAHTEKSTKKAKISREEMKKLLDLSFSISSGMTPINNTVFFDAGSYNEWAFNLSKMSYIMIEEGPSYRKYNPTAVSFNNYVDELYKKYIEKAEPQTVTSHRCFASGSFCTKYKCTTCYPN